MTHSASEVTHEHERDGLVAELTEVYGSKRFAASVRIRADTLLQS